MQTSESRFIELTSEDWSTLEHEKWRFHLASTDNGLCSITLPNKPSETLERWAGAVLLHDERKLEPYLGQLAEYLSGRRKEFTCPIDLRGTPFQIRVWRVLIQIPFGVVKSYSEVATSIEHLTAVRAVGAANRANPIPIVIPCHRVIGKNGILTGYRGGVDIKAQLLRLEGVEHAIR